MSNKRIGIVDADLIGRSKHRFPNLACLKISGYWKERGAIVDLLLDYNWNDIYDEIYISKVFTDTEVPDFVYESRPNLHLGGTGFYFDKASALPDEIEHHMPDYHLYDEWIVSKVQQSLDTEGDNFNLHKFMVQYKNYTDYSIGFITRGCFRKCPFCVNQKFNRVFEHSPLREFYDASRKKICLLDDNFLGHPNWRELLDKLIATNKPFKFVQGMDERLLTDEKCEKLFSAKYDGDYTFAFDNIEDYDLIHEKLKLIAKYRKKKGVKFYVLVGFESTDIVDIENAFKRIALLLHYRCLPYIMRYMSKEEAPWKESEYSGLYITLAAWCNQPGFLKKTTFREFCMLRQAQHKNKHTLCASMKSLRKIEIENPDIAERYFDIRFGEHNTGI